jgi:hypothetical protein
MGSDLGKSLCKIEETPGIQGIKKMLIAHENGIEYWDADDKSLCGSRSWRDISSISSQEGEASSSRVTATRVALLGAFALAAPKKKAGTRFVTVEGSDFFWMVEAPTKDAMEFIAKAKNAMASCKNKG